MVLDDRLWFPNAKHERVAMRTEGRSSIRIVVSTKALGILELEVGLGSNLV